MQILQKRWWAALALGAAGVAGLQGLEASFEALVGSADDMAEMMVRMMPGDHRPIQHPGQADPTATRPIPELHDALARGALKGKQNLGGWCAAGDMLRPCPDLQDRFEHYLQALGEITLAEARVLIEDDARRELGEVRAYQVMALFDHYWAARTYDFQNELDARDDAARAAAVQERRVVRDRLLGEEWSRAFFRQGDMGVQAAATSP